MQTTETTPVTIEVDPARLQFGHWCHELERQLDEGDTSASYSGDLIALESRVRRPFRLQGWQCIAVSLGAKTAKAYRLVPVGMFPETPTTYRDKLVSDAEDARKDPSGFYHGMQVKHGGQAYVLAGPAIKIVAGQPEPTQTELF